MIGHTSIVAQTPPEPVDIFSRFASIIIAGITALGGILSTIILARSGKKDKEKTTESRDVIQVQVEKLFDEISELRDELHKSEKRTKYQWVFIMRLIEELDRHDIVPPSPPEEMITDPEIMRVIKDIERRHVKNVADKLDRKK